MAQILLVDDDPDIIEMNRTVLAQRGYTVQTAGSAAEAKAMVQSNPPDLAVLDVMMEDKTAGFALARDLHDAHTTMPMIMLTGIAKEMRLGYTFAPDETWLPVSKFMEKPVNPRILADEIDKLLKRTV
jgi:DNA-binding response OmpR family regulator